MLPTSEGSDGKGGAGLECGANQESSSSCSAVEVGTDDEEAFTVEVSREVAWKPPDENLRIVETMANEGASPREVVNFLLPNVHFPEDISNEDLCHIIEQFLQSQRPSRCRLTEYNTFADAVELFRRSNQILVLTGAGVSVSCGIPDFRSKDGIYARLHVDFPDLPDPTAMFDIKYFKRNPKPFFEFAREIFPGQFEVSTSHRFIKMLEDENKLLRNYTQNIDTLEQVAGIERIVQCHGSFAKATCLHCGLKVDGLALKEDIMAKRIAYCRYCCHPEGIMKPDIVFFGEDLPEEFHCRMLEDKSKADLVVVIGSSLKVQPVALIPFSINPAVPQILINRESLTNYTADIELLGNCDDIVSQIAIALGPPHTSILEFAKDASSIRPMREIDETEFKKLLEEPEAKRSRTGSDTPPMWEGRFVNVESKLPPDAYLFVRPNKSVFPGAELFFDKDDEVFLQPKRSFQSNMSVSDLSCDSSDSETNLTTARMRTCSLSSARVCARSSLRKVTSCPSLRNCYASERKEQNGENPALVSPNDDL